MKKFFVPCLWGILFFLVGSTLLALSVVAWQVSRDYGGWRYFWMSFPHNMYDPLVYRMTFLGIKLISEFYLLNMILGTIAGLLYALIRDQSPEKED